MARIDIQLLGGFEARLPSGAGVMLGAKKARALLAYLALQPGKAHGRDKLANLLWTFSADEQARTSLRQTLSVLRRTFAPAQVDWLRREGDSVAVDPAALEVDALKLERLVGAGGLEALETAAELYRGDLLDGLRLREDTFEEWLRGERRRLRDLVIESLEKLIVSYCDAGSSGAAVQAAERLLALDPLREDIYRALMCLHAEQGQRGRALEQYQRCCDILRRELGVVPESDTERLYHGIKENAPSVQTEIARFGRGSKVEDVDGEASVGTDGPDLPLPEKPSIAVLPFEDLGGDSGQQYFSDGITSDIVTGLGRFRDLFVIADASSFSYRGRAVAVSKMGRELGVRHVLRGSIRAANGKIRVTAQLLEAATGQSVWAESYDRVLNDVFAVQDEITRTIVATLAGRIDDAARERALRKKEEKLSAYDCVLRGRHHLMQGSRQNVLRARELFGQALEHDPNYARAYVGLAGTYAAEFSSNWSKTPDQAGARAFELARRAVELDDLDSEAHGWLGWLYYRVKANYELAGAQFDKATALNPNNTHVYCGKGYFLTCSGELDEGESCDYYALRLNPLMPDGCLYGIGVAEYLARRYQDAITTFGKMSYLPLEIQGCIAACYAQLGRTREASAAMSEFLARFRSEAVIQPEADAGLWQAYWLRLVPLKESAAREHLFDGLRKAGLPV